jgi:hypothetical protein
MRAVVRGSSGREKHRLRRTPGRGDTVRDEARPNGSAAGAPFLLDSRQAGANSSRRFCSPAQAVAAQGCARGADGGRGSDRRDVWTNALADGTGVPWRSTRN